jgi:hypothetical protein
MAVQKAGEPASSHDTPRNFNPLDFTRSILHFQEAGSTAYSSVHRGNLSTPTSCQCCHTASYTFFIADPDICSHTRDFATVKHACDLANSSPHHHKSQFKATRKVSPHSPRKFERSHKVQYLVSEIPEALRKPHKHPGIPVLQHQGAPALAAHPIYSAVREPVAGGDCKATRTSTGV